MHQCPDPNRTAAQTLHCRLREMYVGVHKNDNDAYDDADQKHRDGFTIVSISQVAGEVICMSTIPQQGHILTRGAWVVVCQK